MASCFGTRASLMCLVYLCSTLPIWFHGVQLVHARPSRRLGAGTTRLLNLGHASFLGRCAHSHTWPVT